MMLQNIKTQILNFISRYTHQKTLFSLLKIIVMMFCGICLYYDIRRPALIGLGYLLFEEVSAFFNVKKLKEELAKDRETISNHWRQDSDLILFTKITRLGYFLVFCLFVASYSELCTLALITDFRYSSCGSQLKVAGGLLCALLFTVFFAEVHIIFYRNFPVINKILSLAQSSVKVVGAGIVMGAG